MLGPAHVDVVPVTPDDASKAPKDEEYSGWDENPWSGAVKDGELFGRGAVGEFTIQECMPSCQSRWISRVHAWEARKSCAGYNS